MHRKTQRARALLALAACMALPLGEGEFDWKRDTILLKGGKEVQGVVIDDCDPEQVVLLLDGGKRREFPRTEVEGVNKLRDRLASFLEKHQSGLSPEAEWQLVEAAQAARLPHMARIQAWQVLVRYPEHEKAHRFLGHERSGSDWRMEIDGKKVSAKKFTEMSREWNSRLVLESEHFVVESDCGLQRTVEVVFDLEALYLWWMRHLGLLLGATEDVDDPRTEKMTFLVHEDVESFVPLSRKEPYYEPTGEVRTTSGGINVARTFYEPEGPRPLELFELGTQSLIYSTLVLGKTEGREPNLQCKRNAHWVEIGLASWASQHAGGTPGYAEFETPFENTFQLDWDTARRTLESLSPPHPLLKTPHEVTNLIGLSYDNFVGNSANIPLCKARCASFVSFLIEKDPIFQKGKKPVGTGREVLWHYFREVYGTPTASSSSAFEKGFGGAKIESFEEGWKAWAKACFAAGRKKK